MTALSKHNRQIDIQKDKRESNIELLRILLMFIIIAHHYVVNSGILLQYESTTLTSTRFFIQIFGCGGKLAIDGFLIISGYFMCTKSAYLIKWLKLVFEICFYNIVISLIFYFAGYMPLGKGDLLKRVIPFINDIGTGKDVYTALFCVLFLLVPFINKLVAALDKKNFRWLIIILICYFSLTSTFNLRFNDVEGVKKITALNNYEGLGWYITVYLIGAYIRLHISSKINNFKVGLVLSCINFGLISASIIGIDYFNLHGQFSAYHFVVGPQKILAISGAFSLFILFKNMHIKYNKVINLISSATFGVLLIHGNSDTMRRLIWYDIFKVADYANVRFVEAFLHAISSVLIVYVVCAIINLIMITFIEKPLFKAIGKAKWTKKPLG